MIWLVVVAPLVILVGAGWIAYALTNVEPLAEPLQRDAQLRAREATASLAEAIDRTAARARDDNAHRADR